MSMKEFVIGADVCNLEAVQGFVHGMLEGKACSAKIRMQLDFVVEEIFVNIASYAYGEGYGDVVIRGIVKDSPFMLELSFLDEGIPYNPLLHEDPDLTLSAEERELGGLGIAMMKKNVDRIHYEYKNGKNVLTIGKELKEK